MSNYIKVNKKEVSNLIRLKGYKFDNRYICHPSGKIYLIKINKKDHYLCKAMSDYVDRQGYHEYVLTDVDGIKRHLLIHRVVAYLFIPNNQPKLKTQVNHIDHNKNNNDVSNLEWVTPSKNIELMHKHYKKEREKRLEELKRKREDRKLKEKE